MSSSPCLLISDLDINIEYKSADEVFCLISNSRFVSERVQNTLKNEEIDGISLLSLNGNDIDSLAEKHGWLLGEKKRFMIFLGLASRVGCNSKIYRNHQGQSISSNTHRNFDSDIAPPEGGNRLKFRPNSLKPDFFKTAVSLGKQLMDRLHLNLNVVINNDISFSRICFFSDMAHRSSYGHCARKGK